MSLSGSQIEQVWKAMLDAFDTGSLKRLLAFELDVKLDQVTHTSSNMSDLVFDLINWSEQHGRTEDLIRAAYRARPHNLQIAKIHTIIESNNGVQDVLSPNLVVHPIFKHDEILKIHELLVKAQLIDQVDILQSGMNLDFRASLPSSGAPSNRVLNTLQILNSTGQLADGEIPLATFLSTAVHLSKPRLESNELKLYLDRIPAQQQ